MVFFSILVFIVICFIISPAQSVTSVAILDQAPLDLLQLLFPPPFRPELPRGRAAGTTCSTHGVDFTNSNRQRALTAHGSSAPLLAHSTVVASNCAEPQSRQRLLHEQARAVRGS